MNIHAIIIALNEEDFIYETIKALYPFCSGLSIITQYDRDYYGKLVEPDATVRLVLSYPDPEGKIHLVIRRFNDETASRNHEMNAVIFDASKGILPHGTPINNIKSFHKKPDYFLICDADEIYDVESLPSIIDYLKVKKPNGMRVSAYEYYHNWNCRVPANIYVHHQFGFVKAGIFFCQRRVITWNELRFKKLLRLIKMPASISNFFWNFIDCPREIGMFHHAGYIRRDNKKMSEKLSKHSHLENQQPGFLKNAINQTFEYVPTIKLPSNIREGNWPNNFFARH